MTAPRTVFDSAVLKDAEELALIPTVKGRMPLLYRHEESLSGGAQVAICSECQSHLGPVIPYLLDLGADVQYDAIGSRPSQPDAVGGRDSAWRL